MFSVKFMTNDCQISFTQIVTEDDDTLQSYKKAIIDLTPQNLWKHFGNSCKRPDGPININQFALMIIKL